MSDFVLSHLPVEADAVERYLQSGRFKDAGLPGVTLSSVGITRRLDTEISFSGFQGRPERGVLHVEDGWEGTTLGPDRWSHRLFVSLETCYNPHDCSPAHERLEADLKTVSGTRGSVEIPAELGVRRVYVGDANRDGDADILVVLSNGAGFLFHQAFLPPTL